MIYLEKKPNEVLAKALGIPKREIECVHGKGNVCNKLGRNRNSKGLVDDDPLSTQPKYIGKLELISFEHDIRLLYDRKNKNYLIVLHPRLEEWILKATKEANMDITEYGLPDDADKLHKIINLRLEEFGNLVECIKETGSEMLKSLERIIK